MIQNNYINNCDVTVTYIDIVPEIWGRDIDTLKGKTTRTKPNPVEGHMIKITKDLLNLKKKVFLIVDLFFCEWDTIYYLTQPQDSLHRSELFTRKEGRRNIQGFQSNFQILPIGGV